MRSKVEYKFETVKSDKTTILTTNEILAFLNIINQKYCDSTTSRKNIVVSNKGV